MMRLILILMGGSLLAAMGTAALLWRLIGTGASHG
jgi:hypothetical protein